MDELVEVIVEGCVTAAMMGTLVCERPLAERIVAALAADGITARIEG